MIAGIKVKLQTMVLAIATVAPIAILWIAGKGMVNIPKKVRAKVVPLAKIVPPVCCMIVWIALYLIWCRFTAEDDESMDCVVSFSSENNLESKNKLPEKERKSKTNDHANS